MLKNEHVIRVVSEWVSKAENDLKNAVYTLRLGKECPTDTVCFHSQQCVEKHLKAFLVSSGIEFPKTHDLEELISLMPVHARPVLSVKEQRRLTALLPKGAG